MKRILERAIAEARFLIEVFKPLTSGQSEVERYQKVIKYSLKRLYS